MRADIKALGFVCSSCDNDAKRMWNGKWFCWACWKKEAETAKLDQSNV